MQITVNQLRLSFSDFQLHIPKFTLGSGEHVLFQGASGCGKTSLLHAIAGLIPLQSGQIKVGDLDLGQCTAEQLDAYRRKQCAVVFQKIHLLPFLNLIENVRLTQGSSSDPASNARSSESETKIQQLLQDLKLDHRLDHLPSELSLGETQRAAIARAFLSPAKLLLLDEPTSSLDDANTEIFLQQLQIHAKNRSLILVTHDVRLKEHFKNARNFKELTA